MAKSTRCKRVLAWSCETELQIPPSAQAHALQTRGSINKFRNKVHKLDDYQ